MQPLDGQTRLATPVGVKALSPTGAKRPLPLSRRREHSVDTFTSKLATAEQADKPCSGPAPEPRITVSVVKLYPS